MSKLFVQVERVEDLIDRADNYFRYDLCGNDAADATAFAYAEKKKPITNADRIRSMTDEEMAEWLERIRLCCTTDLCGRSCPFAEVCYSNAEKPLETLDWLKQEADDG